MIAFRQPLLPSSYMVWCDPPDASGDEILRIVSWRKSIVLKGHSFREFARAVVPLLDGTRKIEDIHAATEGLFQRADLDAALSMLAEQGVVVEGAALDGGLPARLRPQTNYLLEMSPDATAAQTRLTAASVVIFGMGGAGASVARALAVAGVGRIICVDAAMGGPADGYFSAVLGTAEAGESRAAVAVAAIAGAAPEATVACVTQRVEDAAALAGLIGGADLVIACHDAGELNLTLKVNRACLDAGVRFLAGALEGPRVVAGPGVLPGADGPCYMCYRMREVACAHNPQTRFATERRLDRVKQDLGGQRENLVFGADILAGLLGAEAFNILSGITESALDGRIIVFDLTNLRQEKHVVLRKPGCPVCGAG